MNTSIEQLTDLQRQALAICFNSNKVSVSEVQRKLKISYKDSASVCQSIVDAGLVPGLSIAPCLSRAGSASQHAQNKSEPYGWVRMNASFESGVFHRGAQCPPGWVGAAVAVVTVEP